MDTKETKDFKIPVDDEADDDIDTWNDSHLSSDDELTNKRLVKSKGMFDLSKFMIGTGSDDDNIEELDGHEKGGNCHEMKPAEEIVDIIEDNELKIVAKTSKNESEKEDDSKLKVDDKTLKGEIIISEREDVESPIWSDDDLNSWQSQEKGNSLPLLNPMLNNRSEQVMQDIEYSDHDIISDSIVPDSLNMTTQPLQLQEKVEIVKMPKTEVEEQSTLNLFNDEVLSQDSFLPFLSKQTFNSNVEMNSLEHPKIPQYSSEELPEDLEKAVIPCTAPIKCPSIIESGEGKKRYSKNPKKKQNSQKLKSKVEALEIKVTDLEKHCDEEIDDHVDNNSSNDEFSDIDCDENKDIIKKSNTSEKRNILSNNVLLNQLLLEEKYKKSNVRKIVSELKEHKKEQSLLIDSLLAKTHELDLEISRNKDLLKKSEIKIDHTEAHLNTVKSLKMNLVEDIDNQNSLILDQANVINKLKLDINELRVENLFLNDKIASVNRSENQEEHSSKLKESEYQKQIESIKREFEIKIQELQDENNNLQLAKNQLELERETVEGKNFLAFSEKDAKIAELNDMLINERKQSEIVNSKFEEINSRKNNLQSQLDNVQHDIKNLESELNEKNKEVEILITEKQSMENIESLKKQFSHMADTYENKIEKLEEEKQKDLESHVEEVQSLSKVISEKGELINHLKKDLNNIKSDYELRLTKTTDAKNQEQEELQNQLDIARKLQENSINKISKLEFDLENSIKNHKESLKQTEYLKESNDELQLKLEELNGNLSEMVEQKKIQEELLNIIQVENKNSSDQIKSLNEGIDSIKKQLDEKSNEIEKKTELISEKEKIILELNRVKYLQEETFSKISKQEFELQNSNKSHKESLDQTGFLKESNEELQLQLEKLNVDMSEMVEQKKKLEDILSKVQFDNTNNLDQIKSLTEINNNLEKQLNEKSIEITGKIETLSEKEKIILVLQERLNSR